MSQGIGFVQMAFNGGWSRNKISAESVRLVMPSTVLVNKIGIIEKVTIIIGD